MNGMQRRSLKEIVAFRQVAYAQLPFRVQARCKIAASALVWLVLQFTSDKLNDHQTLRARLISIVH
jgi:hypothetical protein